MLLSLSAVVSFLALRYVRSLWFRKISLVKPVVAQVESVYTWKMEKKNHVLIDGYSPMQNGDV